MIEYETLITYTAIVLGFVFIPGPATILTLARASVSGTKAGIATGFGIAVGDMVHTAMAVLGLSAIILTSAFAFSIIKYLGAAYLVYLGIQALFSKSELSLNQENDVLSTYSAFRQAVVVEVLNPKSAIFFLAFLPQFVNQSNGWISMQLLVFGSIFIALGLLSTVVVAIFSGKVSTLIRDHPRVQSWQNKAIGGIYCALGLRLAFQEK